MRLWTVAARQMREDARRRAPITVRALVGLFMCAWFAFFGQIGVQSLFGAAGQTLLRWTGTINYLLITLAAVSVFATAISDEREQGTYDLLRAAGVGPLAVLAGKVASSFVAAVSLLLVELPFTLLAVPLGGVSVQQVAVLWTLLAAYLVLAGGVGTLCSAACARSGGAALLCALALGLLHFGPAIGVALLHGVPPLATAGSVFDSPTPWEAVQAVLTFGSEPSVVVTAVRASLLQGGLCLLAAWWVLSRGGSGLSAARLLRRRRSRLSAGGGDALLWKDLTLTAGGGFGLVARLVVLGLAASAYVAWSRTGAASGWRDPEAVPFLLCIAFVLDGTWYCCRSFGQEWRLRTWSSLGMLPVATEDLVRRKLLGLAVLGLVWGGSAVAALALVVRGYSAPYVWTMVLCNVLPAISLTALFGGLLALRLRHGAFPLAIVAGAVVYCFGMGCCLTSLFRSGSGESSIVVLALLSLVGWAGGAYLLFAALCRRVEELLAE